MLERIPMAVSFLSLLLKPSGSMADMLSSERCQEGLMLLKLLKLLEAPLEEHHKKLKLLNAKLLNFDLNNIENIQNN